MPNELQRTITPSDRDDAEKQISEHHKIIDFDTRKLSTRMRQRLRVFYDAKAGFSGLGLGWASCGGVFSAA